MGLIHLCLRDQHCRAGENYFAQAIRANIFEKKSPMIGLDWWRLPMGHPSYGRCIHFLFRYVSFEQVQTSYISPIVFFFQSKMAQQGVQWHRWEWFNELLSQMWISLSCQSQWVKARLYSTVQLPPAGNVDVVTTQFGYESILIHWQDLGNQINPLHNLTLLQLEQTVGSSGQREFLYFRLLKA